VIASDQSYKYSKSKTLKDRSNNNNNDDDNDEIYDHFTLAALEDKSLNSFLSSKKNGRFYYAQAEYFLRRINVYKPLPIFILHSNDLSEQLISEITSLDEKDKNALITNVVRRIYESIDRDYYHVNGIYGRVKWHIMEDEH
jgi:hypothetical protein